MVAGFAFLATAVSTLFAQATGLRFVQTRAPHQRCWTIALVLFALAAAMLSTGAASGWNEGVFKIFFALGAIIDVPWLALGSIYLLAGPKVGKRCEWFLVFFSGLALGATLTAPLKAPVPVDRIPDGKVLFDNVFPRVLAGVGSGLGATIVFVGALWSAWRLVRAGSSRPPNAARLAGANVLIALGTGLLGTTGLLKGVAGGKDEAFAFGLAAGISVVYAGFVLASGRNARRTTLPANVRGSSDTNSKRAGIL